MTYNFTASDCQFEFSTSFVLYLNIMDAYLFSVQWIQTQQSLVWSYGQGMDKEVCCSGMVVHVGVTQWCTRT